MRLSSLQKHILISGCMEKGKFGRGKLLKFYEKQKKKPKVKDQVHIITKSLERLIDKGFLIGYGVRTRKKWFIKEIKLTVSGRRIAKRLHGEQQTLPLKVKN